MNNDLTLGDLGLDSLMGVEIKQLLERDYDVTLDEKKIRALTFAQLDALSSQPADSLSEAAEAGTLAPAISPLVRYQLEYLAPTEQLIKLNHIDNAKATPVFVVSPIDGSVLLLEQVVSRLKDPVYGLQYTQQTPQTSIADVAKEYIRVKKCSYINRILR